MNQGLSSIRLFVYSSIRQFLPNAHFTRHFDKGIGMVEVEHFDIPLNDFTKGLGVFLLVVNHDFDAEFLAHVFEFIGHVVETNFNNVGVVLFMHPF